VADESKEPDSILEFYKSVLKLRHTNSALLNGDYKAINESNTNVLSYLRVYQDQAVVVSLNMTDTPQNIDLELKPNGFTSASGLLATGKSAAKGDQVSLEPYGVFIGELHK
jgi:alpha-glucosidase